MADLPTPAFATHVPAELQTALRARQAALQALDLAVLDRLLDETLRYTHSNGTCEDKQGYLNALRGGAYRYHAVDESEVEAFELGGGLWCCGRVRMHATVHGVERHMDNRFVAVWRRTPQGLRLAAYGATPIPAAH